jgi:hypothetical protein
MASGEIEPLQGMAEEMNEEMNSVGGYPPPHQQSDDQNSERDSVEDEKKCRVLLEKPQKESYRKVA